MEKQPFGRLEQNMKKRILIAGGDLRQLYCAARLSGVYDTSVLGFDRDSIPDDLVLRAASTDETARYDIAVLPVPPLNESAMLNTPCTAQEIPPGTVRAMLKDGAEVFAGKVDDRLAEHFPGCRLTDYLTREELSLKNAVPTAEGAVQLALEELPVTLSGSKALIVGMGRIGTALAGILKGFGAEVTVAVRSANGEAKARVAGVRSCRTPSMPTDFTVVFNTVPAMIFDRTLLEQFPRETLFIDLASKPGGIDLDAAAQLGRRTVWALGLPGKTAPVTAGEMIAETVADILAERSDGDE